MDFWAGWRSEHCWWRPCSVQALTWCPRGRAGKGGASGAPRLPEEGCEGAEHGQGPGAAQSGPRIQSGAGARGCMEGGWNGLP